MWCKREKLRQLINFVFVKFYAYLLCVELTFFNFAAGIKFVLLARTISMANKRRKQGRHACALRFSRVPLAALWSGI